MQKGQIKQENINKLWYFFMDGSLPPQTTDGNLLNINFGLPKDTTKKVKR